MKNLLIVFVFICGSTSVFGQKITMKIVGLEAPKTPSSVVVTSANLERLELKKSHSQGGLANVYVVNKKQDNLTSKIFKHYFNIIINYFSFNLHLLIIFITKRLG